MHLLTGILCLDVLVGATVIMPTSGLSRADKSIGIKELSARRTTLDNRIVTIRGILVSGHVGPLLKDNTEELAARLRFETLPKSARQHRIVKDSLYRKLSDLANRIPDPDQPKMQYEVELVGLVSVLKKPSYDPYKESPVQIYPLRVIRIVAVGPAGVPKH